jgi:molecular chaperone GrpE
MTKKNTAGTVPAIEELTADLQRVRADFENYRKNVDERVESARASGREEAILKLLPVVDNIERATAHLPADLGDNEWARGVVALNKTLESALAEIGVTRINAAPGTRFDPTYHDAVQFDEAAEGDTEVIESELAPGYLLDGQPVRHAMVRVTRQ